MNTVCKEHEWIGNPFAQIECSKCGQLAPTTDFKISENTEVINSREWEDIWDEWVEFRNDRTQDCEFHDWLVEKYLAPEKK